MNESPRSGFNFPKAITICAVAFAISLGLCGVNAFLGAALSGANSRVPNFGPALLTALAMLSMAGMILSAFAVVLVLIAWGISSIIRHGQ